MSCFRLQHGDALLCDALHCDALHRDTLHCDALHCDTLHRNTHNAEPDTQPDDSGADFCWRHSRADALSNVVSHADPHTLSHLFHAHADPISHCRKDANADISRAISRVFRLQCRLVGCLEHMLCEL